MDLRVCSVVLSNGVNQLCKIQENNQHPIWPVLNSPSLLRNHLGDDMVSNVCKAIININIITKPFMINFGMVYHCFSNIMLAWFQARTSSHPDLPPSTTRRWNPSTPSIIKPPFLLETTIPGYPNDSEQTLFESPTHQVSRASELYFSWAHDVMTHQVGSKSDMNSVNIPALMWPSAVLWVGW